MEVIRQDFDDRSEADENGMYEYVYTGAYYSFRQGAEEISFACYDDAPGVALLKRPSGWHPEVYEGELFRLAVEYLRMNASVNTIKLLDPSYPGKGYIPVAEAVMAARSVGLPLPHLPHEI